MAHHQLLLLFTCKPRFIRIHHEVNKHNFESSYEIDPFNKMSSGQRPFVEPGRRTIKTYVSMIGIAPKIEGLTEVHCAKDAESFLSPRSESSTNPAEAIAIIYDTLEIPEEKRAELASINTAKRKDPNEAVFGDNGELLYASFVQLVLWLCEATSMPADQKVFILTSPLFEEPRNVLAALLTRYFADLSADGTNVADAGELKFLKDRIVRILSFWMKAGLEHQWDDKMKEAIKKFMSMMGNSAKAETERVVVRAAFEKLEGLDTVDRSSVGNVEFPQPMLPKGDPSRWTIVDVPPVEIARQTSLLHMDLFMKIRPMELCRVVWDDSKIGGEAGNLQALVKNFDSFMQCCLFSVIEGEDTKTRTKRFWNWVETAQALREMQNFHGMMSVVCALTHPSISRMSKLMASIEKGPKAMKEKFHELCDICDIGSDYKKYRDLLETITDEKPCIPFIGVFQRELVYVHESFKSRVNGLINFAKSRATSKLMTFVIRKQQLSYSFIPVPEIQRLISFDTQMPDTLTLMRMCLEKDKRSDKKGKRRRKSDAVKHSALVVPVEISRDSSVDFNQFNSPRSDKSESASESDLSRSKKEEKKAKKAREKEEKKERKAKEKEEKKAKKEEKKAKKRRGRSQSAMQEEPKTLDSTGSDESSMS